MNTRLITQTEIVSHQHALRRDIQRSHATFTIAGLRQLFGNTLIAMGTRLHGHDREPMQSHAFMSPAPTT